MGRFYKLMKKQRGAAAVELALLLILLLTIVAGVIEFGRTFWYYDALTKATRDGARFLSNARAASPPPVIDTILINQAKTMVVNAAVLAQVPSFSDGDVEVDCDPDCNTPAYVTVRINAYPITIGGWIPFVAPVGVAPWVVPLSPSTTMRYLCSSTGPC